MELQVRLGRMTGEVEKDVKTLSSFVFQQSEELRYLLNNLDVTNFNDLGLMRYENGRLQIYTEQLNIKAKELTAEFESADKELKTTIEADVNGLRTTVSGLDGRVSTVEQTANGLKSTVNGLDGRVSTVEQTANGLKSTVNGLDGRVSTVEQTASGLQSTVRSQGTTIGTMQSQITQNSNSISLVVSNGAIKAASIVTAINGSASSVKISADHVNISGFVTFTDLSTEGSTSINAGNITTGSISADRVSGGTLEGVSLYSVGTVWGSERTVEIARGAITLANGQIFGSADFGMSIVSDYDLNISAGILYITSDDTTWRLTASGWELWS